MASKYINATTTPYHSVTIHKDSGAILSLNAPLIAINSVFDKAGRAYLPEFYVVTDMTFIGTSEEACLPENPLHNGKKIDVTIRLTRCSEDPNKTAYVDLDSFTIDLAQVRKDGQLKQACWEFYNYTRITKVGNGVIQLSEKEDGTPAYGPYVLKVIIQEGDDTPLFVQGITSMEICEPL